MRRIGLAVVVALALDIAVALVPRALGIAPVFSPPTAGAAPARKVPVIGYLAPEAERLPAMVARSRLCGRADGHS
jgi:hypothetical protein